jgi:hypothetical protein
MEPGSTPGRLARDKTYFVPQRLPEALQEAEGVLKTEPAQVFRRK